MAVAALMGGCAFGGIGSGLGQQPVGYSAAYGALNAGAERAWPMAAAFTPVTAAVRPVPVHGMKTVRYQGYQVTVPANWPVYFLDQNPGRCVRYDVDAVYLGTPGTSQNCPARVVGRADTISIGGPAPLGLPSERPGRKAILAEGRAATGMTIYQNEQQQELAVGTSAGGPAITATYGSDPGLIERILATAARTAPEKPQPPQPTPSPSEPSQPTPPPSEPPQPTPSPTAPPVATASPSPAPPGTAGFDTCTAPPLRTMRAWRARFSAVGIYIGGQMMGCAYGNLTANWIQQAEAMGWSLLPTYVGLQAPCDSFSGKINPKRAAAQGAAAANQAVADADAFGLGRGTPIYYDMEAYDHTKARCVTAVLAFLDAWTRRLTAQGYVSGVYSSADAAIIDLQSATTIHGHPLAEPRAVWFALWDKAANLTGWPYLTSAVWPAAARSKQYAGPRVVKVAGISLDIDSDLVNGPVARG